MNTPDNFSQFQSVHSDGTPYDYFHLFGFEFNWTQRNMIINLRKTYGMMIFPTSSGSMLYWNN